MTAALLAPVTLPTIGWELHRDRRGPATAIAYLEDQECVRLTGHTPLLRLRVAVWTWTLNRRIAATYRR